MKDNQSGLLRITTVCLGVNVGFKLLSERGKKGVRTNLIRESIRYRSSIKSKTITKLFHRLLSRYMKL